MSKRAGLPDFFTRHLTEQKPERLSIGGSDSRAPAQEVTGVEPGSLIFHRDAAHLVVNRDIRMLRVVQ